MGIDTESDIAADLQIGPTTQGMVRLYLSGPGVDLPLDFDPDEADEIAEELRAAAERARAIAASASPPHAEPARGAKAGGSGRARSGQGAGPGAGKGNRPKAKRR